MHHPRRGDTQHHQVQNPNRRQNPKQGGLQTAALTHTCLPPGLEAGGSWSLLGTKDPGAPRMSWVLRSQLVTALPPLGWKQTHAHRPPQGAEALAEPPGADGNLSLAPQAQALQGHLDHPLNTVGAADS